MPENPNLRRFNKVILLLGMVTFAIYAASLATALVLLRGEVRNQILSRDGALLSSVAQHFHDRLNPPVEEIDLLEVALESSGIRGVVGVRLYDAEGNLLGKVPASLYGVKLSPTDQQELAGTGPGTRFYPDFQLDNLFSDQMDYGNPVKSPLVEVLSPVYGAGAVPVAYIQYWLDGGEVATELHQLDMSLAGLGIAFLLAGTVVFLILFLFARKRILNMGRLLEERNRSLEKANADLDLAARTSAIGSVTSHLFHGLKNPLAGLKTYLRVTSGDGEAFALAERMQSLIDETLSVIRESDSGRDFDLSFAELLEITESRFSGENGQAVLVEGSGSGSLPARKSRLLLLILRNLVENAADASPPGGKVLVRLEMANHTLRAEVEDKGSGLPEQIRERLFEPVQTSKRGGTGIGLALSAAIARQIPASLSLKQSSDTGTTFSLEMPL
jgi:signal transduction histidine kinase